MPRNHSSKIATSLLRENSLDRLARQSELQTLKKCREVFKIPSSCPPMQVRERLIRHLTHVPSGELVGAIIIAGGLLTQLAHEGRIHPDMDILTLEWSVSAEVGLNSRWSH